MTFTLRICVCLSILSVGALTQPSANRITLDVVAKDKSGKAVPGLQEQDFTVLDGKQPRKIISFDAIAGPASASDTNVVLLVDAVNTPFQRVAYERGELDKFLKRDDGKLNWPITIALFTDSGVNIQPSPSRDGNALAAYIDQNETGLRAVTRSQGFYGAVERLKLSLNALSQVCQKERTVPGRKILVWISPGWPLLSGPHVEMTNKQEQQTFQTIVQMSIRLREARIALYAVDPLGMSDSGETRTFYYKTFLKGVKSPQGAQLGNLGLQVLAEQSGGKVFNSNNDIAGEVEECVRDSTPYYVISYDGPRADGPDDYHPIEVKIAGHDIKAQTRSGYYAEP
ncbi:MAG: VWA domain-containing protein [Bryobacteraceae bacterium]